MTTSHTPRFSLPIPTWNADWQKWQQVFETFATGVDSTLFSLLEHTTLLPRVLPTVSITGDVFSQSGPAQFVSRTLQVAIEVGPNSLTLIPGSLVCAHLLSGAVGPQAIEWELRITSTEADADLVVFGVVGDDYAITWYNGARLVPGTPMALFAFAGGGGGASSLQEAYNGGASIAIPVGGDPVRVNNGVTGAPAIVLGGAGPQRLSADGDLELSDGNYYGEIGPADAIPLTSVGARDFTFACASLVDAINKAYGSGGSGSLQDAYDAGSSIGIPVGGDPVTINNGQAGEPALLLEGTGPQRVKAEGELELADGGYLGIEGPPDALPLSDPTARDFVFPCESLIDGINQAYLGAGAVAWSGYTNNDTPTELFVRGVALERHVLPVGSTVSFQLTAIARDNLGNRSKVWTVTAVVQVSIGGTPSWVSIASPAYAVVDQSDSSGGTDDWDIAVSLNAPDRTFRVTVTGQTSTSIQWAVFTR